MAITARIEQSSLVLRSDLPEVDGSDAERCLEVIHEHRSVPSGAPKTVVLDFSIVALVKPDALATLAEAARELGRSGVRLLVLAHKSFAEMVRAQGLEEVFQCFVQTHHDPTGPILAPSKPDTKELLDLLLVSVATTLKLAARTSCLPGKSLIRDDSEAIRAIRVDIAGMIGLVSKPFKGTITLAFPSRTYLTLVSRILGSECTDLSRPEAKDWAGELLNIILGQSKAALNRRGYDIQSALPSVVRGTDLEILQTQGRPSLIVPFTSDSGPFYFELSTSALTGLA